MAEGSAATVALPAIVDLDVLDVVRDRLLDAIESGPVTVNGAAVERVATNAALMLISAAETARRNRFSFVVEQASAPLLAAIARLGLEPAFAGILKR
ncbi:MAG TPA: STAS domain-containing protein [Alphaproteobacteria bacterium]|nr:STAS domain-containing protein [Alphaproteobacteria bacterium]